MSNHTHIILRFQFLTSVTTSPKDTGFTLFSSSTMMFKYLPPSLQLQYLRCLTWSVSTSSFNATVLRGLPLVVNHPQMGRPCLRFHEPWPQSKTKFDATNVEIEDASGDWDSTAICDALTELLHDRRVAYYHAWEKGDLLVSDNILAMHTRSDFKARCDRELWRINFE
jgi:alpha-ketoglutarate-dependent taurine dioxygenase